MDTSPSLESPALLLEEARALASLDHPNVGVIHEIGEASNGQPFIAMAYYDGITLAERIRSERLTAAEAVRLMRQVGSGLLAAHQQGRLHCDLKPSNILLVPRGTESRTETVVKIEDFGISKFPGGRNSIFASAPGFDFFRSHPRFASLLAKVGMDVWPKPCEVI